LLRGTFRCFNADIQKTIVDKIAQIVMGICESFEVSAEINFNSENPGYPVTFNAAAETKLALQVFIAVAGESDVDRNPVVSMGLEYFVFKLQEKPGCYIWIGNGSSENNCLLHNPHYDFNDEILAIGAAYWVKLVVMC
jgi:hippurate hydrolase